MIKKINAGYKLAVIRGATTATGNTVNEIENAVIELIEELISRNNLKLERILSVTFTVFILLIYFSFSFTAHI